MNLVFALINRIFRNNPSPGNCRKTLNWKTKKKGNITLRTDIEYFRIKKKKNPQTAIALRNQKERDKNALRIDIEYLGIKKKERILKRHIESKNRKKGKDYSENILNCFEASEVSEKHRTSRKIYLPKLTIRF